MNSTAKSDVSCLSSLHWVLKCSDWSGYEIQEHLKQGFYYIGELDEKGRTPLLALVEQQNCSVDLIEILLKNGADANAEDFYKRTPLIVALENECCGLEVIEMLLEHGADVNHKCIMGISPLITALHHSRELPIIRLLLQKSPTLETSNYTEPYPLCVALRYDASIEVVRLLLDNGCTLNGCPRHGSALHCATSFLNPGLKPDILDLLLEKGASLDTLDLDGQQLMCFALQNGADLATIELLLRRGVKLDNCVVHTTPLLCATCPYCDFMEMTKLIRLKTDEPVSQARIPLRTNVLEFLLKNKTDCWMREGFKPALCALRYCDYEAEGIGLLLKQAAHSPWSKKRRRCIFIKKQIRRMVFKYKMPPKVVKLLIHSKLINLRQTDPQPNRSTLLHRALALKTVDEGLVKVLLDYKASVYKVDGNSHTPLYLAIKYKKNKSILELLLRYGSKVGTKCSKRPLLLELALKEYDTRDTKDERKIVEKHECLKLLLKYGFLENPFFDIGYLISSGRLTKDLVEHSINCRAELRNISKYAVGNEYETLYDIVVQPQRDVQYSELDCVLRILKHNSFPIYIDTILAKIERELLLKKLRWLPIHTVEICPDTLVENEACLTYECAKEAARFLSKHEFLNLILMYYDFHLDYEL
ncbi:hypothetical protein JTE90_017091 [Oedothorax gibbosus]|uniref:Alpha-latrotoxin n=1 Tax=Oedothorax gibbosus TaxID=931172 RepID=A0AAV6UGV3_9ARAC|nr:hypothetical protein JTE90_017091 [Oedothorax gibbosus]